MADTLGLHISADGIAAVRLDAVAGTAPDVVQLGADSPVAPTLVVRDDGGAVRVGTAAVGVDGPSVTDPLERAAAGQVGALAAVINHVVGRAAMAGGAAPARLAVVVPDDFDAAARDRVVEAGGTAGAADTVAVPVTAASTRVGSENAAVALAAGAARVASLAAAPLVTREDLGETVERTAPVVPPVVDAPSGSVSVFDESTEPEAPPAPPRPAPVPVAARPVEAAPPTQVVPAAVPPAEPLRYEPPSRRMSGGVIAVIVLLVLIAIVGVALAVLGGDDDPTVTEDPDTSTTTTAEAPTTTASSTTTEPTETTTSLEGTPTTESTTTTSSTTTSSTTTTTTTTTPVAVAAPGVVTLVETGLQLDGGEVVLFGQSDDSVIEALTEVVGEPDMDSGFEESAFCFGSRSRFVSWGELELVFTEEELDTEEGRFSQWHASGHDEPEGLVTFSGIGVGATVGYLEVTLGSSLQLVEAIPDDPTGLFAATNPGSGGLLNGTTSSRDPNGLVTALWAGDACTRIFT
ncbi:MAG: hypothetical protein AAF548_13390 [Actinomycetota bacterium]